jgi:basic amino acid/polyamine antiporter, APA family
MSWASDDLRMNSAAPQRDASSQPHLVRRLTFLDTLMLCVGGVIGSAIFLVPHDIAGQLRSPIPFLAVWLVGGMISLLACFAFAEMGAMFPEAGGQYVYLREAFGDVVAFLYGWMYFAVEGSGSIAALAVAFASYFGVMVPALSSNHVIAAAGSWSLTRAHLVGIGVIALLTTVNILGVKRAAVVQNVAGWLKYLAMALFVVLGFAIGKGAFSNFTIAAPGATSMASWTGISAFGVALISVFWAYDGWVYVGLAAGEVKNPGRNLPLALIGGILLVCLIYVAMNLAYIYGLGLPGILAGESTTAHEAATRLLSPNVGWWISALVAVSCFGALSSAILSTARVSYAMAADGLFVPQMARVHPEWHTPWVSLAVQAVWAGLLTLSGRYDQIITYIMSMGVISYGLAVAGLFVLRRKYPDRPRPYRCTGYPILPAIYVIAAALWAGNTLWQRPLESLAGVGIVALGLPGYYFWRKRVPC